MLFQSPQPSPTEPPPTEQPPAEQPPTEQPPTEQPPAEPPPTEPPPTEQPPTEQPPAEQPTSEIQPPESPIVEPEDQPLAPAESTPQPIRLERTGQDERSLDDEEEDSPNFILDQIELIDTIVVSSAYVWLCCGVLLFLLVPIFLSFLYIRGRSKITREEDL